MPGGGDCAPEGAEPLIPTEESGGRENVLTEQPGGGGEGGAESGGEPSSAEAGQEDEEMTSGSHDLCSSANHSPRSPTGSGSTKSCASAAGSSSLSLHSSLSATGSSCSLHGNQHKPSKQTDSGRGAAHQEMRSMLEEVRKRLPAEARKRPLSSDQRAGSKTGSSLEALQYALHCVKQVQANSQYYKLLMTNGQTERPDATVCSLDQLDQVTSEHTLKNTDSFVLGFSLASGRVRYVSEQAPSMLCCRRKFLEAARFVELLFHQDVSVFYAHTAQPRLPLWRPSHHAAVALDCAKVKSFFCRIRGGKDHDGDLCYHPFRMTPYLLKVQEGGASGEGEEPCCLALVERIISGYEAPRIPVDKRIFTTTHSPGCVFLEVDDRAVPLLGYLPQDLIGRSLLTCVHPEDRPLMLSMHRKVLKYAGQSSFDHSPVRLRCQNGDYVTVDTSWSSFINPWSRKVAFIIGRHKVTTSPLNEDVFAARSKADLKIPYEEIKDLQAKIYKLFLQPVRNAGSSGYGSLGSNGSHEHHISATSSSDGNLWEETHPHQMTQQPVCADVNRVKSWGQQVDCLRKLTPLDEPATAVHPHKETSGRGRSLEDRGRGHEETRKPARIPSYQQINCVDSIIRYLESCTVPALKRKSESRSLVSSSSSSSSSTSEDDEPATATDQAQASSDMAVLDSQVPLDSTAAAVVTTPLADITLTTPLTDITLTTPLTDITLSTKAMSVMSLTSQCSYSSTIVHVPPPESEVTALEDAPTGSEPADPAPISARPARSPAPSPAAEELRLVGLTKEVLAAHTQKEEQEYVDRLRHRILQSPYSNYLQQDDGSMAHSHTPGDQATRPPSGARRGSRKGKKSKHKRPKPQDSSDSYGSPPGPPLVRPPLAAPDSSWPSSESSQPQLGVGAPHPLMPPPQTLLYSRSGGQPGAWQGAADQQSLQPAQNVLLQLQSVQPGAQNQNLGYQPVQFPSAQSQNLGYQPVQFPSTQSQNLGYQPVQFPGVQNQNLGYQPVQFPGAQNQNLGYQPVQFPCAQSFTGLVPASAPAQVFSPYPTPMMTVLLPSYSPAMYPISAPLLVPQTPFPTLGFAPGTGPFSQPQFQPPPGPGAQFQPLPGPQFQPPPGPQTQFQPLVDPVAGSVRTGSCLRGGEEEEEEEEATAPGWAPLVSSSRSSSPLQLNLLQEELPRPGAGQGHTPAQPESLQETHAKMDECPSETENQDGRSTSSELLEMLLQEDARSGTGSNTGSLGSGTGSNGTSTSHTGSSNSSDYFASNDSSDTSRKAHKSLEATRVGAPEDHTRSFDTRVEAADDHTHPFDTRVENSMWGVIQNTPELVMMTYQMVPREQQEVLAEDREKLRLLQTRQPQFSREQRAELAEVHPWILQRSLPREIDTQGCVSCVPGVVVAGSSPPLADSSPPPYGSSPPPAGPSPPPAAPDSSSSLLDHPQMECSPELHT